MHIVHIAAGAGSMYCGACARDVNLIRGLIAAGHDVQVIPLYTPLRVEGEETLPTSRIFYSGINVYLQQMLALFRLTPGALDRLFEGKALLRLVSKFAIETRAEGLGPMTISVLAGKDGFQRKELGKLLDYLAGEVRPDVVTLTNSLLSGIAPEVKRRLNVPVVCMLQGEESFVAGMPEPYPTRARELMQCNARAIELFISPGEAYARQMATYLAVPEERVRVIRAGIDGQGYACEQPGRSAPFTVGYLSVITPGKGLDLLLSAFTTLVNTQGREAVLRIAGKVLNKRYWESLQQQIHAEGLAGRVEHLGEVDFSGKVAFLQRCSVFVFPSRIPESRGMVAMEAMAAGTPVIMPASGVLPEMHALTGGSVLFPAGDAAALTHEIARLMDDPPTLEALGRAGAAGIARHFSAQRMTEETIRAYEELFPAVQALR